MTVPSSSIVTAPLDSNSEAEFDDRDLDVVGYEFILQKVEPLK